MSETPAMATGSRAAESKADKQRTRILNAAERLIATHGFDRVRLLDIAREAGVSIGTLQHYFDTRERLLREAFQAANWRRARQWSTMAFGVQAPWDRIVALLDHAVADRRRSLMWVESCAVAARYDELRPDLRPIYEHWRQTFRDAIADGLAAGDFDPIVPVDDVLDTVMLMIEGSEIAVALGVTGVSVTRVPALLRNTTTWMLGMDRADQLRSPATRGRQTDPDAAAGLRRRGLPPAPCNVGHVNHVS